jgi:hypothetical protein
MDDTKLTTSPARSARRKSTQFKENKKIYFNKLPRIHCTTPLSLSCLTTFHALFYLDKKSHVKNKVNTYHGATIEQRKGDGTNNEMGRKNDGGILNSVGYLGRGFLTARLAWARLQTSFYVGGVGSKDNTKEVKNYATIERSPENLLVEKPVDLLVVDSVTTGDYKPTGLNKKGFSKWLQQVRRAKGTGSEPKVVAESWCDGSLFDEENGPAGKRHRLLWEAEGFITRVHRWEASRLNSALRQERIMVFRIARNVGATVRWAEESSLPARAMSNMLRFTNVPRKAYVNKTKVKQTAVAAAINEPLPPKIGDLIETKQGIRHTLADEYARSAGVPKGWIDDEAKVGTLRAEQTTCVNIWEAAAETLRQSLKGGFNHHTCSVGVYYEHSEARRDLAEELRPTKSEPPPTHKGSKKESTDQKSTTQKEWSWVPPDLSEEGAWYATRVENLKKAAATLPNSEAVILDGLLKLKRHRKNYTKTHPDPKKLQVLWWEFPPEHWNDLLNGCPMNFLHTPQKGAAPNSPMDPEQLRIAVEFVEELIELGVLAPKPKDTNLHSTTPLFCLAKAGQPGQWRVIANCRTGGQNDAVGSDPVILPRINHILPRLYQGGWSAVVDASKMFYQFPTKQEEQKFLGVIHPVTGEEYVWAGLPMGAGNSPACAC